MTPERSGELKSTLWGIMKISGALALGAAGVMISAANGAGGGENGAALMKSALFVMVVATPICLISALIFVWMLPLGAWKRFLANPYIDMKTPQEIAASPGDKVATLIANIVFTIIPVMIVPIALSVAVGVLFFIVVRSFLK